jgi:hypothetical protein
MDEWPGTLVDPLTLNPYVYALASPVNYSDPSGYQSELEKWYINRLYDWYIEDTASRLNVRSLTNLSDDAFAALIAARFLAEDATIFADRLWPRPEEDDPGGFLRQFGTLPVSVVRPWVRDWLASLPGFDDEISWGPANMRLGFVIGNLQWWEQHHSDYGLSFGDVRTYYYNARERNWLAQWLFGNEEIQLAWELQTSEGTVHQMSLAILRTSWRIKEYYQRRNLASGGCEPIPDLSAYMIAMGIINYDYPDDFIFEISNWTSQGFPWVLVEALDGTAEALGFSLVRGDQVAPGDYYDYLPYTTEEKEKLESIPRE